MSCNLVNVRILLNTIIHFKMLVSIDTSLLQVPFPEFLFRSDQKVVRTDSATTVETLGVQVVAEKVSKSE